MKQAENLHDRAMELLDAAFSARRRGDELAYYKLADSALSAESKAAQLLGEEKLEPSRSVLFRSAASVALMIQKPSEALALAAAGLIGQPPGAIRDELVQLIKESSFQVQMGEREGVQIAQETLTMALEGKSVGNGVVEKEIFTLKLNALSKLIRRTADRVAGFDWQNTRAPGAGLKQFVSAPIQGSFAVRVVLGDVVQRDLPGFSRADATLAELVECFNILQTEDVSVLEQRIGDNAYFANFLGLARDLVPDGRDISAVRLSAELSAGRKSVNITRTRKSVHVSQPSLPPLSLDEKVEVSGVLSYADAVDGRDQVKIVLENGSVEAIHVPAGLMDDIVRPYFGLNVQVSGIRKGGKRVIELEEISARTD